MFAKGERIHTHDGKVHVVRQAGQLPRGMRGKRRGRSAFPSVRGFVKVTLDDVVTGDHVDGDWHENVVTVFGFKSIVRNFLGIASSGDTNLATTLTDLARGHFWAIGSVTAVASTDSAIATEYGLHSSGGASRATVSLAANSGQQCLSGTWSLQQSMVYLATQLSHGATLNCVGQHYHSSVGQAGASALSLATFNSVVKSTTQQLNVIYNWLFST